MNKENIESTITFIEDLVDNKSSNAFEALIQYVDSEHEELREMVAVNLADFRSDKAFPYLLNYIKHDPSNRVRTEALESLVQFKGYATYKILLEEIENAPENRRPYQIVATALGDYPTTESIDILYKLLEESTDYAVWIFAVDSLAKVNNYYMDTIWKSLLNHPHSYVQDVATRILEKYSFELPISIAAIENKVISFLNENNNLKIDFILEGRVYSKLLERFKNYKDDEILVGTISTVFLNVLLRKCIISNNLTDKTK